MRPRQLRMLSSPEAFRRTCLRAAAVLVLLAVVGIGDRLFFVALAGLLVVFALLARLAASDLLADPEDTLAEPEVADEPIVDEPVATVQRTFRLPATVGQQVALVGELNGWSHTAHPMRREGSWFTTTVELEAGRTYRYRYLVDGERWENDWAADAYVPNAFGAEDSVAQT